MVISFIVEAFVFNMQATQKKRSCEKHTDATSCECVRGGTAIYTIHSQYYSVASYYWSVQCCSLFAVAHRKKLVHIYLVTADIIKLKYEIAYSDKTCRTKDLNYFMRRWRRVDLDHSHLPVSHTSPQLVQYNSYT